jgi:hypothetical protein
LGRTKTRSAARIGEKIRFRAQPDSLDAAKGRLNGAEKEREKAGRGIPSLLD